MIDDDPFRQWRGEFYRVARLPMQVDGTWSAIELAQFFFAFESLYAGTGRYVIETNFLVPGDSVTETYKDMAIDAVRRTIPSLRVKSIHINSPGKIIFEGASRILSALSPAINDLILRSVDQDYRAVELERKREEVRAMMLANNRAELENVVLAIDSAIRIKERLNIPADISDRIDENFSDHIQDHPLISPALRLSAIAAEGKILSAGEVEEEDR